MSSNPLFSDLAAEPGQPSRLRLAFFVQVALMLLVVALGGWMLHLQSRGAESGTPVQAAAAHELMDAMGQASLYSRQIVAAADPQEAQRRHAEARERVQALERRLRQGWGQPVPAWLPSLLDSVASAREDVFQWLDLSQRQARDGQAVEAARTLQTRALLAEARWRAQAEELQRRIALQLRSEQQQQQEASQRLLLQWLAWSLTAVALAGGLGWSLLRRGLTVWENQLRAVPPSRTSGRSVGRAQAAPSPHPAEAQLVPASLTATGPFSSRASGQGGAAAVSGGATAGDAALLPPARGTSGLTVHPMRRATDRLQRKVSAPAPAPAPAPVAEGAAPPAATDGPMVASPGASKTSLSTPLPGQAESARQVIARAKAAANQTLTAAAPLPAATEPIGTGALSGVPLPALPLDPELLRTAADSAERGSSLVSQVVAHIEDIGATGRRIAEIVAVIDSIAFQTNLLALNAAVEAARSRQGSAAAGAAADVRSLAQRATQAAREIRALVQAGGDGSAGAVAQALQQDTGTTMEALLTSVQQAAEIVTQVRQAADGRSAAAQLPVQESVQQLDRMQRNHAALAEQSAGTAESLRQQAERLQKVLGAFKLLQQTQQAAWGAHTAIRDARHKASSSANDSGFGSLGGPTWRPDPGNSGEANGTDGGWRPF